GQGAAAGGGPAGNAGARLPAADRRRNPTRYGQLVLLGRRPGAKPRRRFDVGFLLLAVLLAGCTLQPDVSQAAPHGRVGTIAPRLSGETLEGSALRGAFHQGQPVLVLWGGGCRPV